VYEFTFLLSGTGAITFVNDRALRASGHTRGAIAGLRWSDLFKKPDGKPLGPALFRPGSKSNPQKKNFALVAGDGRLIPCSGKIYRFGESGGEPGGTLVLGTRVKTGTLAGTDLMADHRLLQSLVESLPDGFAITSGKGVVLAVNRSFAALTERPVEDLVGSAPPHAWWGKAGNQQLGEALSEVRKTGAPAHRLVIAERRNRPAAAFSYWIAPLRGSFAGLDLYLASMRDISEIHPVAEIQMSEKRIERLKQQVHRNAVRLKMLQDINTAVLNSGSLGTIFQRITGGLVKLVDHDLAGIYVFENDDKKILKPHTLSRMTPFSRRLGRLPLTFGEGIIGSAAVSGKTVMVNNAQRDPRSMYPPGMKPEIEHIIASPLRGRGSVYGILVVARNRDPGFHDEDALVVQSFADAANVAIDNMRLFLELHPDGQEQRRAGKGRKRSGTPSAPAGEGRELPAPKEREEITPVA